MSQGQQRGGQLQRADARTAMIEKRDSMRNSIESRIATLEELLPEDKKPNARRYVATALLYFTRDEKLHETTPASFIQCIYDSVSLQVPLDGRLGHAVVFNTKVKTREGEHWEKRVKFMPDFKGIVTSARRTRQIRDAQTDIVYENDRFIRGRIGDQVNFEHIPADIERGNMIGAYCILTFYDKPWTYEYMTKPEIDKVRASSKAANDGPWVNWYEQMARKTVIKRALKTYCDDPELAKVLEFDDREWHDMGVDKGGSRVALSNVSALSLPKKSDPPFVPGPPPCDDPIDVESHSHQTDEAVDPQPEQQGANIDVRAEDGSGATEDRLMFFDDYIATSEDEAALNDIVGKMDADKSLSGAQRANLMMAVRRRRDAITKKSVGKKNDGQLFGTNKQA